VQQFDEVEREMRLEQIDDLPCPAVPRIDNDLQRLERRTVDITQQVLDIGLAQIDPFDRTALDHRGVATLDHEALDVGQTGVATDRPRRFAHELHPVVVLRVVARGDHHAAVETHVKRGEVHLLGSTSPDIHDVDTGFGQTGGQRLRHPGAGQTNVVAHGDTLGSQEQLISMADTLGQRFGQLVADAPADVVGLETRQTLDPL